MNYILRRFSILFFLGLQLTVAEAATYTISPETVDINSVISNAASGDNIHFKAGHYVVHLKINKPLILNAEPGTTLDGNNTADVIRIRANNVIISGFRIINSGHNLTKMNAGIFVEPTANNVLIKNNYFDHNAFGIFLDATKGTRILNNRIHGEPERRSQDRGNGIHMYATTDALVQGNEVWETRDGIYIDTSNFNTLNENVLHDLRYGVHYMYSYDNTITSNRTFNTRTGYAFMQSKRLTVLNNQSDNDKNYGMLLNFITHSTFSNNIISNAQIGSASAATGSGVMGAEGKAIFIYNSQFNTLHDNQFSTSDIGIHITAGSEDNSVYGNAFIKNRVQVKYVANVLQEWSMNGRGNYWSDYLGWDMDANGIGDKHYEPNDAVDKLLWKYPVARVLLNSPAIQTLRWVQERFPVLRPQGVRDSAPLMSSPLSKEPSA